MPAGPLAVAWESWSAIDARTALWLLGACVLAYFLKGFSGFGPAMVFIPSVSVLFDPRTALAASAFIDIFVGVGLLRVLRYEAGEMRLVLRLAAFMAVGTVTGAALAGAVSQQVLLTAITVVILGFGSSLIVFHRPLPVGAAPRSTRALALGCVVGGVTGGLVGISGPFIIVVLRPLTEKGRFRRVLVALFLIEGAVKLAAYALVGVWTPSTLPVSAVAAPAVALGLALGMRSHAKVNERLFSAVVGVILVALAVRLLLR